MASSQHLGQYSHPQFQSPAKVFARLKSKVQRERICTNNSSDPPCNVKGNHFAEFMSPRKTTHIARMDGDITDGFGPRNEAKTFTISPIPSPQENLGCWNLLSSLAKDKPLVPGDRRGAFLESTALPQAQFLVNKKQIHEESAGVRDVAAFHAGNNTPVKSVGNDCMFRKEHMNQVSPSSVFSPIKNRLRKRKIEPWDFNNVSTSTKIHNDSRSQSQDKPACAQSLGEGCFVTEDLVHRPDVSAVQADISHFPQGAICPPTTMPKRYCSVLLEKCPTMSPAKMFAYMKKREGRAGRQDPHPACNSIRDLFNTDGFHQCTDMPPPEAHTVTQSGSTAPVREAGSGLPVRQSRAETAEGQSAVEPSEDVGAAAPVLAQPVLLEDPLILNSPRVTIPKNNITMKPSCPQLLKVPSERVIHLQEWCLKHNKKGLYVEGIHREEHIQWNSNIIAERVSPYVVKTITGRLYILIGKMNLPVDSSLPRCFLKKFLNGFPPKWSTIYEEFLSDLRIKDTGKKKEDRGNKAKPKDTINFSLRNQQGNILTTPDVCPPSSSSSTKMSRSGRIIKPPLEYWKGGRVILDAQMNVTIHECYDRSICRPEEDTAAMSTRKLKKPLFPDLHCDNVASAPQRNVKASSCRRNKGRNDCGEKTPRSPDPPVASLCISAEGTGRWMRSSQTRARALPEDPEPQWNTRKMRGSAQKRDGLPSQASPDVDDTSPEQPSNHSLRVRRAKRSNRLHKKRGEDSAQLQHLEESRMEVRKRGGAEKDDNKRSSEPTNMKSSTSSKTPKTHKGSAKILSEEDEDKWTEDELARLQEAMALYPKHKASYWAKVAKIVRSRSAEECYNQHTFQGSSQSPVTKDKKRHRKQLEAPKGPENPLISAGVGTLKRKQQVRHFLETMPKQNMDDVFSSSYMQNKRFQIPSAYQSHLSDDPDITLRNLEPVTPMSTGFPEVKTPQCLHISPGMMGSPNRRNDDKYVYQLQKRMKKRQFNVCKKATSKKSFTPTPSVKRKMRRCGVAGQDTFVVWEMFPGSERVLSDSEEEEDYYFSDNDCA